MCHTYKRIQWNYSGSWFVCLSRIAKTMSLDVSIDTNKLQQTKKITFIISVVFKLKFKVVVGSFHKYIICGRCVNSLNYYYITFFFW
jgi:hypothetical protein